MTYYDSCGWLPFGLGANDEPDAALCLSDKHVKIEKGKCIPKSDMAHCTGDWLKIDSSGHCTLDLPQGILDAVQNLCYNTCTEDIARMHAGAGDFDIANTVSRDLVDACVDTCKASPPDSLYALGRDVTIPE